MKKIFTYSFSVSILLLIVASDILAIPAFARKYNMSCKTCHSPIPYLKDYGEEFAGNGFQLSDKDAPRYFVNTGDDKLDLIRDFPLAVRIQGFATYNRENEERFDIGSPTAFKIMSGGEITKDAAYYVYYILENGEVGKIEDAWFMLNNLFDTELDFFIGQFQVSDPLFKRELRLTNEDYIIYKVRPGDSGIDLTYDRGIMLTYSLPSSTDIIFELVNGTGIGELYSNKFFDKDNYKNLVGRISQGIGDHFRLGALGYWGNEENEGYRIGEDFIYPKNEVLILGGDATVKFDPLELNIQYVQRDDDNPYFYYERIEKVKTRGGFVELIFRPNGDESDWYAAAVYNQVNSDDKEIEYKTFAAHIGYLLSRNIRIIGEYGFNIKDEFSFFDIGFITAF